MTEDRKPIQISDKKVLCSDGTIWSWSEGSLTFGELSGWVKMPPIPTDEEYESLKQKRKEVSEQWFSRQFEHVKTIKND